MSACLSKQNYVSMVELLLKNHVSTVQGQFRHFWFKCRNKSVGASCAKSKIEGAAKKKKKLNFSYRMLFNTNCETQRTFLTTDTLPAPPAVGPCAAERMAIDSNRR